MLLCMDERRLSWERRTEWPLALVATAFLVAYSWPILDPRLGSDWSRALTAVSWLVWAVFALDYAVRLMLADRRAAFIKNHPLDLASVVLPLLRPLRLLRLVRVLSALNRPAGGSLRGRVIVYVAGATALLLFVASLAVLDAERGHPEASIQTFKDAVWWSVTTVTTVGYGDHFPVTDAGRLVAVGLMVAGIALIGVITATFASWLLARVDEVDEPSQAATRRDIEALTEQIAELRRQLDIGPESPAH